MKKTLFALLLVLLMFMTNVQALESEPDGKNLLNPSFFEHDSGADMLYTTTPVPLEAGETYTFSASSEWGWNVKLFAQDHVYADEKAYDHDACSIEGFTMTCTFDAVADEVDVEVSGGDTSRYYGSYGLELFQLEAGGTATDYEPYIPKEEGGPPEFSGGGTFVTSYTEAYALDDIIDNHISAYDAIDGDVSDSIKVVEDAYTGNESTVGAYEVVLEASDSSDNTAYFDLLVSVIDDVPPVIEGEEAVHVDVDEASALTAIIDESFAFHDEYDGTIDEYSIVSDDYTGSETVLGAKAVTIEVSDAAGNITSYTFDVVVEDITPPVISGPESNTVYLSNPKTLDDLLALYEATDNHTPAEEVSLEIIEEAIDFDAVGTYDMVLRGEDASGNQTTKSVEVVIIDDVPPVFTGPSFKEISYTWSLDLKALIADFTIEDNHDTLDEDDVVVVKNDYQEGIIGEYEMLFEVADASGNRSEHAMVIAVIDDVPPYFILDERITVTNTTHLSSEEVFLHLKQDAEVEAFAPVAMEVIAETYTENSETPGIYEYEVELMNAEGARAQHSVEIEVVGIVDQDSPNWFIAVAGAILLCGGAVWVKRR